MAFVNYGAGKLEDLEVALRDMKKAEKLPDT
jgi:hypothetical protein